MYRESGFTLSDSRYHILSGGIMQDSLAAKGVMGMRFKNNVGDSIWLCATHLQDPDAGYPGLCKWITKRQFTEVLDIVGVNNSGWARDEEIVVFGDFNLSPGDTADTWTNSHTPLVLLDPLASTHVFSAETLDYGLTTCHPSKKVNIKIVDDHLNPSDHRAICINIPHFGYETRAHIAPVPNLSLEITPILIFILSLYWLWEVTS